jgi:uncharacterized membrane protein YqiK
MMNEIVPSDGFGMLATMGSIGLVLLVALLAIGLVIARLYKRASKETGFVRTGFGGEKVVINGGALVLPVLHETMPVNMNTVRLPVERRNGDALITSDRMRIGRPHHAATGAERIDRRQVCRCAAIGGSGDDDEPVARTAR